MTRLGDRDFKFEWPRSAGATSYGIRFLTGTQNPPYTHWVSGIKGNSFIGHRFSGQAAKRFAVYAQNKDGASSYRVADGYFYLPLNRPTSVQARRGDTPNQVVLSWRSDAYYQSGVHVQKEQAGVVSDFYLGSGTGGRQPTTWTDSDASLEVRYRVRYFAGAVGPVVGGVQQSRVFGYWSAWTPTLFAGYLRPHAPSVTALNAAVGSAARVDYKHESADGTAQVAAKVRYRKTGDSAWVEITRTTQSFATLPTSLVAGEYEVQAATKGSHADYSEWSLVQTFLLVTRPVVTVTNPPTTFTGGVATATWAVAQAEGIPQSRWEVELRQGSTVLLAESGVGATTSKRMNFDLANSSTYVMAVAVWCAGIKSVVATKPFTTSFIPPAVPTLAASWVEEAGAHEVTVAKGSGGAATTALNLYRSNDDGQTWENLGDYVAGGSLFDYEGNSNGSTHYRAVAETALGALATVEVEAVANSGAAWILNQSGDGIALRYNLNFSVPTEPAHSALIWLDGDTVPTVVEDSPRSVARTVSITADLLPAHVADTNGLEALATIQTLQNIPGVVSVRLPNGQRIEGSIRSVTPTYAFGRLVGVAVTVEEGKAV